MAAALAWRGLHHGEVAGFFCELKSTPQALQADVDCTVK